MDESDHYSLHPFVIASGAAIFCCVCTFWALRSNPGGVFWQLKRTKFCRAGDISAGDCDGHCVDENMALGDKKAVVVERQGGASMMELLVPEITIHALSYLDYTSLCRLSMTNSAMRSAANDDGAWKALYHKDFTVEQDNINPSNGWKAYYATTKAVVTANAEFYNIIRERSFPDMSQFWLNADYVNCIHASGELFTGYNAVLESWALAFNWGQGGGQGIDLQVRNVRARILGSMAWVTMNAYVDLDMGSFHVTNIYEFHHGQWYMVHHHSSMMLN
ncbi:F-box protein SKIP8-like [Zingiber officinale]|uniref:F-box protein SKIP8 n=1 Tax=Zingiber officinale TaxID=94328 RepID=A0A8J5ESG5_ZINOF|nr:F-box protein SKIP8-like [Zingiber officinale]KAG6473000.1 hypothetical protein ZIOFF_066907 [Zingiber officinale]